MNKTFDRIKFNYHIDYVKCCFIQCHESILMLKSTLIDYYDLTRSTIETKTCRIKLFRSTLLMCVCFTLVVKLEIMKSIQNVEHLFQISFHDVVLKERQIEFERKYICIKNATNENAQILFHILNDWVRDLRLRLLSSSK